MHTTPGQHTALRPLSYKDEGTTRLHCTATKKLAQHTLQLLGERSGSPLVPSQLQSMLLLPCPTAGGYLVSSTFPPTR